MCVCTFIARKHKTFTQNYIYLYMFICVYKCIFPRVGCKWFAVSSTAYESLLIVAAA